jgi:di/tricarboxylate transporter
MLALTGSPVSVIVSNTAAENGFGQFGYFSFTLIGVPLLVGTMLIVSIFGKFLLPDRTPRMMPVDFSNHTRELAERYSGSAYTFQLQLTSQSGLVGMAYAELRKLQEPGVSLIGVRVSGTGHLAKPSSLAAGDTLVIRGDGISAASLAQRYELIDWADSRPGTAAPTLFSEQAGVVEVIVPPGSPIIGEEVFPGMVTDSGSMVVLEIQRGGVDLDATTALQAGDVLLVQGSWDAFDRNLEDPNFLVVHEPALVRPQVAPIGRRGLIASVILVGMIVLLATGVVPPVAAGLIAAIGMVLSGLVPIHKAYRAINWTTVVLVAGMIPLSIAMRTSGAANELATRLVELVGTGSPYLLVFALCLLTAVLGQLISNTATALIVMPVALSAAADTGLSGRPLLMAVNIAAAAAFLTPVATPVNLMVAGPAGYKFGDYWKLGLPLTGLFIAAATFLVPVFWHF